MTETHYASLTPAQALDLAAKLTAAANRVWDAQQNGTPSAYEYVRPEAASLETHPRVAFRIGNP